MGLTVVFVAVLVLVARPLLRRLRSEIGLLNKWVSIGICLGIIAIAIVGKLGGSVLAGRLMGLDRSTTFIFGALMNTGGSWS